MIQSYIRNTAAQRRQSNAVQHRVIAVHNDINSHTHHNQNTHSSLQCVRVQHTKTHTRVLRTKNRAACVVRMRACAFVVSRVRVHWGNGEEAWRRHRSSTHVCLYALTTPHPDTGACVNWHIFSTRYGGGVHNAQYIIFYVLFVLCEERVVVASVLMR